MDVAKENEKTKLEILSLKTLSIQSFNEDNLHELNEILHQYTSIIKNLNTTSPEIFSNLVNHDSIKLVYKRDQIDEYSSGKAKQLAFQEYKDHLQHSIETAIYGLTSYLEE